MNDSVGGRWGKISPDRPEIAECLPPMNWAHFLNSNRGGGFLHFVAFSHPESGMGMDQEISDSYPCLGCGECAERIFGGRPGHGSKYSVSLAMFMDREEGRRDRRRADHDSPWVVRKSWAIYQNFTGSDFRNLIAAKDSSILAHF